MKTSNKLLLASLIGILAVFLSLSASYRWSNQGINEGGFLSLLTGINTSAKAIKGNGNFVTKTFKNVQFDKVKVAGKFDVTIKQGSEPSARISIDENIMPHIKTKVHNGTLSIKFAHDSNLKPSRLGEIVITSPEYKTISLGGMNVFHANKLNGKSLNINLAGKNTANFSGHFKNLYLHTSGKAEITGSKLDCQKIKISAGGEGVFKLNGKAEELELNAGGRVDLNAKSLLAKNVTLNGAGSSSCVVNAQDSLNINVVGHSVIKHVGKPDRINNSSLGVVAIEQIQ